MTAFSLADLARIVAIRAAAPPAESYTAKLLADGPARAAKKLGEEAVEAAIAAATGDRAGLVLEEIMAELERRTAQGGLAEKAARGAP